MLRLTSLLLAAALSTCSANAPFAADAPTCPSPKPVAEFVAEMTAHETITLVEIAPPDAAKRAVEIINAMPPETDATFDTVVFVSAANGSGAVFLGNGGVCHYTPFRGGMWTTFLRSVRGLDS